VVVVGEGGSDNNSKKHQFGLLSPDCVLICKKAIQNTLWMVQSKIGNDLNPESRNLKNYSFQTFEIYLKFCNIMLSVSSLENSIELQKNSNTADNNDIDFNFGSESENNNNDANVVSSNDTYIEGEVIPNIPMRPNLSSIFETKIMKDLNDFLECGKKIDHTTEVESKKSDYYMKNMALLINSHPDILYEKENFYGRAQSKNLVKISASPLYQRMVLNFCDNRYINKNKNPDGYYHESISRMTKEKTEARWSTFDEL
jgi:hypothetical protein